ncbi:hypothetical protein Bhyg_17821, partial [Pseudolycoriella hygida]
MANDFKAMTGSRHYYLTNMTAFHALGSNVTNA